MRRLIDPRQCTLQPLVPASDPSPRRPSTQGILKFLHRSLERVCAFPILDRNRCQLPDLISHPRQRQLKHGRAADRCAFCNATGDRVSQTKDRVRLNDRIPHLLYFGHICLGSSTPGAILLHLEEARHGCGTERLEVRVRSLLVAGQLFSRPRREPNKVAFRIKLRPTTRSARRRGLRFCHPSCLPHANARRIHPRSSSGDSCGVCQYFGTGVRVPLLRFISDRKVSLSRCRGVFVSRSKPVSRTQSKLRVLLPLAGRVHREPQKLCWRQLIALLAKASHSRRNLVCAVDRRPFNVSKMLREGFAWSNHSLRQSTCDRSKSAWLLKVPQLPLKEPADRSRSARRFRGIGRHGLALSPSRGLDVHRPGCRSQICRRRPRLNGLNVHHHRLACRRSGWSGCRRARRNDRTTSRSDRANRRHAGRRLHRRPLPCIKTEDSHQRNPVKRCIVCAGVAGCCGALWLCTGDSIGCPNCGKRPAMRSTPSSIDGNASSLF